MATKKTVEARLTELEKRVSVLDEELSPARKKPRKARGKFEEWMEILVPKYDQEDINVLAATLIDVDPLSCDFQDIYRAFNMNDVSEVDNDIKNLAHAVFGLASEKRRLDSISNIDDEEFMAYETKPCPTDKSSETVLGSKKMGEPLKGDGKETGKIKEFQLSGNILTYAYVFRDGRTSMKTLIITKEMEKALECALSKERVLLVGPKGAGKTTTLYYVYCKLTEQTPKVIIFSDVLDNSDQYCECLRKEFARVKKMESETERDPFRLVYGLLKSLKGNTGTFLADIKGNDFERLKQVYQLVYLALEMKWKVICALSSGCGWTLPKEGYSIVDELKHLYCSKIEILGFSKEEACHYLHVLNVKEEFHPIILETCGCNPKLLARFHDVQTEIEFGYRKKEAKMFCFQIVKDIKNVDVSHDLVQEMLLSGVKMLAYFMNDTVLKETELDDYFFSYGHVESLTYLQPCTEENENVYRIMFWIPCLKDIIFKVMRNLLAKTSPLKSEISRNEAVRGIVYEAYFLSHEELTSLDIVVTSTEENAILHRLTFEVHPTYRVETGDLKFMTSKQIYCLKRCHPFLDAVCLAEEKCGDKYILLIQISLSSYTRHKAKCKDICKKYADSTVAEYYRALAKVNAQNVVYVYISPREHIEATAENTLPKKFKFDSIFKKSDNDDARQYLYGVLESGSECCKLSQRKDLQQY